MSTKTTLRLCQLLAAKLLVATLICVCAAESRAQTRQTTARAANTRSTNARSSDSRSTSARTSASRPQSSRASGATDQTSTLSPVAADETPSTSAAAPPVPEDAADLAIIANVQANELRFDAVPNPTVEFPGHPARATEWSSERTNLPPQVQPGVTYRDIGIRLKIVSLFPDIDRIVAEALGETPTTDDASPLPESANGASSTTGAAPTTSTPSQRASRTTVATRASHVRGATMRRARAHATGRGMK